MNWGAAAFLLVMVRSWLQTGTSWAIRVAETVGTSICASSATDLKPINTSALSASKPADLHRSWQIGLQNSSLALQEYQEKAWGAAATGDVASELTGLRLPFSIPKSEIRAVEHQMIISLLKSGLSERKVLVMAE